MLSDRPAVDQNRVICSDEVISAFSVFTLRSVTLSDASACPTIKGEAGSCWLEKVITLCGLKFA